MGYSIDRREIPRSGTDLSKLEQYSITSYSGSPPSGRGSTCVGRPPQVQYLLLFSDSLVSSLLLRLGTDSLYPVWTYGTLRVPIDRARAFLLKQISKNAKKLNKNATLHQKT